MLTLAMTKIPGSILVTLLIFNFSLIFLFKTALVLLTCIFCLQPFILNPVSFVASTFLEDGSRRL